MADPSLGEPIQNKGWICFVGSMLPTLRLASNSCSFIITWIPVPLVNWNAMYCVRPTIRLIPTIRLKSKKYCLLVWWSQTQVVLWPSVIPCHELKFFLTFLSSRKQADFQLRSSPHVHQALNRIIQCCGYDKEHLLKGTGGILHSRQKKAGFASRLTADPYFSVSTTSCAFTSI